jgi:hypothetical protein
METILEQLDNGTRDKISAVMTQFLAEHPEYGHDPRATRQTAGKTTYTAFTNGDGESSRYWYDGTGCTPSDGWHQYDTDQDAHYFGVWYHMGRRIAVTYAEGDETIVVCHTAEAWRVELKSMADFYGDPPPAFKTLDVVDGQMIETHHFDEDARPKVTP